MSEIKHKQHYIPCMLLKNWSTTDKGRDSKIICYNLKDKKSYSTKIDTICFENNLHETTELKTNSIENYLGHRIEPIANTIFNKLKNSSKLSEEEIKGLYILTAHFFLRSSYLINNVNVNKSVYLLKSLVITKNNEQEILNQIITTMSNKYIIIGKTNKQILLNDLFSVIPISLDDKFNICDWYFPISFDTCIIISNNEQTNTDSLYIDLSNDFVDYINSLFINTVGARFIYSKDHCESYIQSLIK